MNPVTRDAAISIDRESKFQFPKDIFSLPRRAEDSAETLIGYNVGHSLGLQSRLSMQRVNEVMRSWKERAVRGHFTGEHQWLPYHEEARTALARLTGGKESECVMMNSLTANIHLLFVPFYRPHGDRKLLLMESGVFPSDRYAVQTHLRSRGINPATSILQIPCRPGENILREEDILAVIEDKGEKIETVFLSAVQFRSGQVLDLAKITKAAHAKGCKVGFDLAHAIGNVELSMHEIGADFAVFCGYKYLLAGPGNGAGAWVHERHVNNPKLTQYAGWWGNSPDTRFEMRHNFEPRPTADRFAVSNPPIHSVAAAMGGLDTFELAARLNGNAHDAFWDRREQLWKFLHDTVSAIQADMPDAFEIITPEAPGRHGAMLSLFIEGKAEAVEEALQAKGFAVDARGKSVVRISVSPFWGSAEQIFQLGEALRDVLVGLAD